MNTPQLRESSPSRPGTLSETIDHATPQQTSTATVDFVARPDADAKASGRGAPALPGYEILNELGRGGMGVVYLARQTGLGRLVALKMILGGAHAGKAQLERFVAEARAVAQLQHPNVVQIYEIGEHEGLPYFSLEYVGGGSLQQRIGGKPQPARESAQLTETLARAMEFAHQHGIIHRDLKPANILLAEPTRGRGDTETRGEANSPSLAASPRPCVSASLIPKITDFGLAKRLQEDSGQTRTGTILGTPNYMAPEQALGTRRDREPGPSADVYALGGVLYAMLTGRPPFQGETVLETLEQVRTCEPPPPTALRPSIPRDLDTICLKCLQKEPTRRYASAGELADDLRRFLDGKPVRARPVGHTERLVRWCKRNPRVAGLSAAVALLLVAVAVTSTVFAFRLAEARQLADERADEAEANAQLAMAQADVALDLVYKQVTRVHMRLRDQPGTPPALLQSLLKDALEGLNGVAVRAENTALATRTRAGVFQRIGAIYVELGRLDDARKQLLTAQELIEGLLRDKPADPMAHAAMGVIHLRLAELHSKKEESQQVRALLDASLAARQRRLELQPDSPEALLQLAIGHGALGKLVLQRGDPRAALGHYRQDLACRDRARTLGKEDTITLRERAAVLDELGRVSTRLGAGREARGYSEQALRLRTTIAAGEPDNIAIQDDVALSNLNIGDISLLLLKDFRAARVSYDEAVRIRSKLFEANPQSAGLRARLALACYCLGTACWLTDEEAKARAHFARSLELREPLAKAAGADVSVQIPYMLVLARCGRHGDAAKIAEQLSNPQPPSPKLLYQAACGYALCRAALVHPQATPTPGPQIDALTERYTTLAIERLREAIRHGWKDATEIEGNPELDSIRQTDEFARLLADLRRTVAPAGAVSENR